MDKKLDEKPPRQKKRGLFVVTGWEIVANFTIMNRHDISRISFFATVGVMTAFTPLFLILFVFLGAPPSFGSTTNSMDETIVIHIQQALQDASSLPVASQDLPTAGLREEILRFYEMRDFAPAWLNEGRLSSQGIELLAALNRAPLDGLDTRGYYLSEIDQLLEAMNGFLAKYTSLDAYLGARLDLLMTHGFMAFATHLLSGRIDPQTLHDGEWKARPRKADVVQILQFSLENQRVGRALNDMIPPFEEYLKLRSALEHYRLIAELGGWPEIPSGPLLRPGDQDERVPLLRKRLWMTGDLSVPSLSDDLRFDRETAAALRRFQLRHGLAADRVLGPATLAELNRPAAERVRQLELNLERWRWLPKDLGSRHIRVNIADFRLQVVEDDMVVMSMPVVVGTAYRKTPVFSGHMTYLEFAPYWGVPETILTEDKLPRIRRNLQYLEKNYYEIIPWRGGPDARIDPKNINWQRVTARNFPGMLRQKPGPWNPLGQVKFMFPNEFDVYLHDTPDRHLFAKRQRTFSSGCIRIERAYDLAQYLLEDDPKWDCDRIYEALNAAAPLRVNLRRPLPVHLLYFTSWVDREGLVHFRKDHYERDAALDLALRQVEQTYSTAYTPDLNGLSNN